MPTHSIPCYNKKRKCPNIWSSPRFWLLSYTDTRPLQCIRLGRSFFSLLLIKVRKNCNNSADNCCCTCNNSNKPVNIHCKASSYSNSGNPVECGRHLALIKEPLKKNSPSGLFFRFIYHECSLDLSSACSGISNNCILSLNILFV